MDGLGSGVAAGDGGVACAATVGGGLVTAALGHSVSNVRPAQKPKPTSKMASSRVPIVEKMPREAGLSPAPLGIGR
jgi:hypothetical protein